MASDAGMLAFERASALVDGFDDLLAIHSILKAPEMNAFSETISSYVRLIGETIRESEHRMSEPQLSRILRQITESRLGMSRASLDTTRMDKIVDLRMAALKGRLDHDVDRLRV